VTKIHFADVSTVIKSQYFQVNLELVSLLLLCLSININVILIFCFFSQLNYLPPVLAYQNLPNYDL